MNDINHIEKAFADFTKGSTGFCHYVWTNCGLQASTSEIERIAEKSETPAQFMQNWEFTDFWTDENNA